MTDETVQTGAHGHSMALFVGVGHVEAIGLHFLPAQGGEGITQVCGDEDVIGRLGEERGLDPGVSAACGKAAGRKVSSLLQ